MSKDTIAVARAALDYIDALPKEIVATLPAMPGFDRDWAENVLAAGVPAEVLEQASPVDRRFMVDMSVVGHTRGEQKLRRAALRDEANVLLEQAEAVLIALVESYTTEPDGKFSACHPRSGFSNTLNQIHKLRKTIKSAKL